MKTQKIVAAVAAAALGLASMPGFAQSYIDKQRDEQTAAQHLERTQSQQPGARSDQTRDSRWNGSNGNDRRDVRGNNSYNNRNYGRDDNRYNRGDNGRGWGHEGRGAGPDHAFYRGGRLPPEYRSRQYVVDDWRAHHLSAPPRGYHWVQTGGDYVLAAIATGVIASILLNQ
jgi:Ni/Co efflux regulator RcnB